MNDNIESRYDLVKKAYAIGGQRYDIWQLVDFEKAVDRLIDQLSSNGSTDILPEDCPYFGQIWSAALYLSELIARLELQGRRILELGCGLALPSLVAARRGARTLAVDIHADVQWFVEKNAACNDLSDQMEYRRIDWRHDDIGESFDFIMGSDILYENAHPEQVVRFLDKHLTVCGQAIIVDPCRWHHLDFCKVAEAAGFCFESRYDSVEEDGKPVKIHVVTLKRVKV